MVESLVRLPHILILLETRLPTGLFGRPAVVIFGFFSFTFGRISCGICRLGRV